MPHLLADLLADPATAVLELADGEVPVSLDPQQRPRLVYRSPRESDLSEHVMFLGRFPARTLTENPAEAAPARAVVTVVARESHRRDEATGTQQDVVWEGVRRIGPYLDALDLDCVLTAQALANWHDRTRFCSRCGAAVHPINAGWVLRCPGGHEHYPRTDPAMIVSVIDPDDRLLLARNESWDHGRRSVLAGFLDAGERGAAAVVREVAEEVGVRVTQVEYVDDQPWPFPGSLMLGYVARAERSELHPDRTEIVEAEWYSREQLREAVNSGHVSLPSRMSIARRLIERWYGGPLTVPAERAEEVRSW